MKKPLGNDHFSVTSGQACARLGISRDTLYAYVSRGLVRTVAQPGDARKSLYDRRDIAALLERKSRGRSRRSVAESTINWGEPVLASGITRIADGSFFYRGRNAVELSGNSTLEDALTLLADVRCNRNDRIQLRELHDHRTAFDRILTMLAAQATGAQKGDGRPRAGHIMRLTALCAAGNGADPCQPIHELLGNTWSRDPSAADLIRRALVLCADHELNASTYAARVAASAGASLPASLLAGLATLSGSAHGGLTLRCRRWMQDVEAGWGRGGTPRPTENYREAPGFGHPLYPDGDPRAAELLARCPVSGKWQAIIDQLHDITGLRPALDFALAHLERELKLPNGAGLGIFAVGRTAGWMAHIFEQRRTGRLIRPRAQVDT